MNGDLMPPELVDEGVDESRPVPALDSQNMVLGLGVLAGELWLEVEGAQGVRGTDLDQALAQERKVCRRVGRAGDGVDLEHHEAPPSVRAEVARADSQVRIDEGPGLS